jgi:hypothetical protein
LARVAGFFTDTLNNTINGITSFISGTAVYKTVAAKLEEFKNAVLNIIPPSPTSIKTTAETISGVKTPL